MRPCPLLRMWVAFILAMILESCAASYKWQGALPHCREDGNVATYGESFEITTTSVDTVVGARAILVVLRDFHAPQGRLMLIADNGDTAVTAQLPISRSARIPDSVLVDVVPGTYRLVFQNVDLELTLRARSAVRWEYRPGLLMHLSRN